MENRVTEYFNDTTKPHRDSTVGKAMLALFWLAPTLNCEVARALVKEVGLHGTPEEVALRAFAKLPTEAAVHELGNKAEAKPKTRKPFHMDFNRERSGAIFGTGRKAVNH